MNAEAMEELLPHRERLLILAKTYPLPSTQYRETVCVAAINDQGLLRRLYPVPFRFLDGEQQFRKWEWIEATISKAHKDNRPESFKIDADSIVCTGVILPTHHKWRERTRWIEPHISSSLMVLKQQQQETGKSLGFLRPSAIEALCVTKSRDSEWTLKQIYNLQRVGWFDGVDARKRFELRKVPYDFHYEFQCGEGDESEHA